MRRSSLKHSNASLSYLDINLDPDGCVLTREQIKKERIRRGFCPECEGVPTRLYRIENHLLWKNSIKLSVDGETLNGQCLRCNPRLDPGRRKRKKRKQREALNTNNAVQPSSPSSSTSSNDIIFIPDHVIANSSIPHFGQELNTTNTSNTTNTTNTSNTTISNYSPPTTAPSQTQEENICLLNIDSYVNDVIASGDTAYLISIIVNHMKEYIGNPTVQEYFLGKVWDLCKESDDFQTSFLSYGGLECIIAAMDNFGNKLMIQEQGCGAISALCTSAARRMTVVRAGATNCIVAALINNIDDENLVATALGCIRIISPEVEARACIAAMSGVEYVCKAMKLHLTAADIQRDGCNILSNCAVDAERQEVSLMTEREVKAITEALFTHKNQPSVISGGCFAIKNFSHQEQNIRRLRLVDGFIEFLENVNQYCTDWQVSEDSCIILERILESKINDECLENQVLESISQIANSTEEVIDRMQEYDWSSKILTTVFHILTLLFQQYPQEREKIYNRKVIGNIIAKMKQFKAVATIQINGCKLLSTIATDNANARKNIIDVGGCQVLMTTIKAYLENAIILDVATNTLRTLSTELKCSIQLQQSELFLNRVGNENCGILKIQENCQRIINNISLHQMY